MKRKILIITISLAGALLIAGAAALLIFKPWVDEEPSFGASGEALAVMTTKVAVYDGIWDAQRYSDELYYPTGIALMDEDIVVADTMCDRIVVLDGNQNKRIGRPGRYGLSYYDSGALIDGHRQSAMFMKPSGVAVTPAGDAIIADTGNNVIRKMDDEFVITIAGNVEAGFRDGKEGDARFNAPRGVAVGADGTIYIADTMNHCIRRIDSDGVVTLFAGTPEQSGHADGSLASAQFHEPSGIAISPSGDIYIADSGNHCIRKISGGTVSTVAGMPGEVDRISGYPLGGYVDGGNSDARFNFPRDVALLPESELVPGGGILVADTMNHAVRLIDEHGGTTRTILGSGAADAYYLSAENLRLTRPEGICTDGETIYVSDTFNNRVLAVPLTERILRGRPSRGAMLRDAGITTDSRYSYNGDIRVFIGGQWLDMGRVAPWNTPDYIYIPIRPLMEALGAHVELDDRTAVMTVTADGQETHLRLDYDYFIMRGMAVTTSNEIIRLFPYTFEWFPEYSLIALHIPEDLR